MTLDLFRDAAVAVLEHCPMTALREVAVCISARQVDTARALLSVDKIDGMIVLSEKPDGRIVATGTPRSPAFKAELEAVIRRAAEIYETSFDVLDKLVSTQRSPSSGVASGQRRR